jgi:hypothetical protein
MEALFGGGKLGGGERLGEERMKERIKVGGEYDRSIS